MFSCEFCKISKNTFSYRTLLVASSGYSEQVIPSRTFLLCSSEQVILSRRSLPFQVDYTKNVYNEQNFSAILCSLNQSEYFEDSKKVIQSRNFLLFFFWYKVFCRHYLQAYCYSQQTCAPMFSCLALTASERDEQWNATIRSAYSEYVHVHMA